MEAVTTTGMDWARGTPITLGPWMLGLGEPSPETAGYWDGVERDVLRVKHCRDCGKAHHPRRMFCDACPSAEMEWIDAAGTGTVYTYSVVHRAPDPVFQAEAPYAVGLVELDEGVYLFSRLIGDVAIGARVQVAFEPVGSHGKLPVFHIA